MNNYSGHEELYGAASGANVPWTPLVPLRCEDCHTYRSKASMRAFASSVETRSNSSCKITIPSKSWPNPSWIL
ncbi:hypothetical protein B0H10DRAFT_2091314 [Mycena sp. CBHHK59/15]|nr:hypothetical protein B0H10DRAFT_2119170 [Mycena sp. CBHHK59/15]KAJ6559518.1 hypothetical protein B0H10DRAFT_2119303 [Mycena sp. CBHHK59/15]KAJ6591324.1 hypothetical protein B0H10DRAFT_2091314 [Mycena sp. CBHHK59/15]